MAGWPGSQLQDYAISSFLIQDYSPGERDGLWTLYMTCSDLWV